MLGPDLRESSIYGEDRLEALVLAIRYLGLRLNDFRSKGGRTLAVDDGTEMNLDEIFGALLRAPAAAAGE